MWAGAHFRNRLVYTLNRYCYDYIFVIFRSIMPRGPQSLWSSDNLVRAVNAVVTAGMSKKGAAKMYGIPRPTLQRHIKKAEKGLGVKKQHGRPCVLSQEQEESLCRRLLDMEARLYGLTVEDVRRIVYQFCEINNIKHNFSTEKRMAGRKWVAGFFRRNKDLAVRLPEKTSLSRAVGFNQPKVRMYFDLLSKSLFENAERKIPAHSIYNVDETGFTVCQKSQKIVGKKGKKNVGILTKQKKEKMLLFCVVCPPPGHIFHQCLYFRECECDRNS